MAVAITIIRMQRGTTITRSKKTSSQHISPDRPVGMRELVSYNISFAASMHNHNYPCFIASYKQIKSFSPNIYMFYGLYSCVFTYYPA